MRFLGNLIGLLIAGCCVLVALLAFLWLAGLFADAFAGGAR